MVRLAFFVTLSLLACRVWGDLGTAREASIEWKVHSSDAIYVVERTRDDGLAERSPVRIVDVVLAPPSTIAHRDRLLMNWTPPRPLENAMGEWLLFIRQWDDRPATVAHQVYLSNPLKSSRGSAITAAGRRLPDKDEVLQAVDARLSLRISPTAKQRAARDAVDRAKPSDANDLRWSAGEIDVDPWLGGFERPIEGLYWDQQDIRPDDPDPPIDESLMVNSVIVPADRRYRSELLATAQAVANGEKASRDVWRQLTALVNYPDEETHAVLSRLASQNVHFNRQAIVVRDYLRYFASWQERVDESKWIGSWRIDGRREVIAIRLHPDRTFTAHGRRHQPSPPAWSHWWGMGRWAVIGDRLTLLRLTARKRQSDPPGQPNRRSLFGDKRILKHTANQVVLEAGPPMVRAVDEPPNH